MPILGKIAGDTILVRTQQALAAREATSLARRLSVDVAERNNCTECRANVRGARVQHRMDAAMEEPEPPHLRTGNGVALHAA